MDLGQLQELFSNFATFGQNIGAALAGLPKLIIATIGFAEGSSAALDVTKGIISS